MLMTLFWVFSVLSIFLGGVSSSASEHGLSASESSSLSLGLQDSGKNVNWDFFCLELRS